MSASSVTVRAELCEALRLDLVGPGNDHAFAKELLPEAPSRWYLTGFLVLRYAPEDQRVGARARDFVLDPGATVEAKVRRLLARGILKLFEDVRGENRSLDADAGVVHLRFCFGARRYFCRRLLGFSGMVYSIRPVSSIFLTRSFR